MHGLPLLRPPCALFLALLTLVACGETATLERSQLALSTGVVISQVYGGGGNTNAAYRNDFVELFNRGSSSVNLSGMVVAYQSAGGSTWLSTSLTNTTLLPGQYYLVVLASGGTTGSVLPTSDKVGTTDMSASNGKVALVASAGALSSLCPGGTLNLANAIDYVAYGTTSTCAEVANAPSAASAAQSVRRLAGGCAETDNASADFSSAAVVPHNKASTVAPCSLPDGGMAVIDAGTGADAGLDAGFDAGFVEPEDAGIPSGDFARFSEFKVNPGGPYDAPFEYIELIGSGTLPSSTYVLSAFGGATAGAVGRIDYALDLSGKTFGSNGMMLIKAPGVICADIPAGTTVIDDAALSTLGGVFVNGTQSMLLVQSAGPLSYTVGSTQLAAFANLDIIDAVGFQEGGITYGGADLTLSTGEAPHAAVRFPHDYRAQRASAWFYGRVAAQANSNDFDTAVGATSVGFPTGATLTPGLPNTLGLAAPAQCAVYVDAGIVDSGTPVDAGPTFDAGIVDAGAVIDSGTTNDAGSAADSGSPTDAGEVVDAGALTDAGSPKDSGTADAGMTLPPKPLGCGCSGSGAELQVALGLVAAALFRRPRKKTQGNAASPIA